MASILIEGGRAVGTRGSLPSVTAPIAAARRGRARSTSRSALDRIGLEMFAAHGFDAVTVDDIAAAAGIGRRTFFRYFPSKNDLAWGDFDALLARFRIRLEHASDDVPLVEAIRDAVHRFNDVPPEDIARHRLRMRILLNTPELVAHSTVRYAEWRAVIADFVARRRGMASGDPLPQAVSWACLGISLAAYEQWLALSDGELLPLIDAAFHGLRDVFSDVAWDGDVHP